MKTNWTFLLALLLFALPGLAQTPPPDGLVSPEVHADGKVTFRMRAPKAAEVTLFGDWMPVGSKHPLTKDAEGVWSTTISGIEATIHLYSFTVDGVTMADPVNPRIKLRQRTSASLVEIPAKGAPWESLPSSDPAQGASLLADDLYVYRVGGMAAPPDLTFGVCHLGPSAAEVDGR